MITKMSKADREWFTKQFVGLFLGLTLLIVVLYIGTNINADLNKTSILNNVESACKQK